ncbi:hypothetical protein H2509_18490 [Stappia sp. F7233]|uniref:Uncharacterized protein n=1 Tax=Stappia albiluteola TaxID=2758565 RepID=A0A839AHC8_9HYPH|nr:hypothetical protein [Stappia albiluteola]MBA5779121.1 hypothetical protein [Stappia albiluteola]
MTSTRKDALWRFLFASDGCQLVNLKLMRGDSHDFTAQGLREQVHSALMQVKTGTSERFDSFPEASKGFNIDLRELAAKM